LSRAKRKERKEHKAREREQQREAAHQAAQAESQEASRQRSIAEQRRSCPVCGTTLDEGHCARCGTSLLGLMNPMCTLSDPLQGEGDWVRVRGKILMAPVDPEREFELELDGAVTIHVNTSEQTRWLHTHTATEDDEQVRFLVGAEAQIVGTAADSFNECVGGLREAAVPEHQLQAIVIGTGANASNLLDHEFAPPAPSSLEVPEGEPPYPIQVAWEQPHPTGKRLVIFHQPREPTDKVRGVFALLLGGVALGLLTLSTGSCHRALELFNVGAPWVILPTPFLLYVGVMAASGGRRLRLGKDMIQWSYAPVPWWPGWRTPPTEVERVYREGNTLWIELRHGEPRKLLPTGTVEQLDYVEALASKMLLEGPGPWVDRVTKDEHPGSFWQAFLLLMLLLPMIATVLLIKAC